MGNKRKVGKLLSAFRRRRNDGNAIIIKSTSGSNYISKGKSKQLLSLLYVSHLFSAHHNQNCNFCNHT